MHPVTAPSPPLIAHGSLRALQPRGWRRVVGLVSLALLARGLITAFGYVVLGFRREGELRHESGRAELDPTPSGSGESHLVLDERVSLLGRIIRRKTTVLVPDQLSAVTLTQGFAQLGTAVGVGAFALGSFAGVSLLLSGLTAPGLSGSLLAAGLFAIATGALIDFLVVLLPEQRGTRALRCSLRVELPSGRGFELDGCDAEATREVLAAVGLELPPPERAQPQPLQPPAE